MYIYGHCTSCGCDKATVDPTPNAYGRASLTYVDGTCVEMLAARTVRSNNTSGVRGVYNTGSFTMSGNAGIFQNSATKREASYGGGAYVEGGTFTMIDGKLFENTAAGYKRTRGTLLKVGPG